MEAILSDYKHLGPLLAVFMSGVGFSLQTLIIKKLEESGFGASFQVIFFRGMVQCALASYAIHLGYSTTAMGKEKGALFGSTNYIRTMLFCRSVIGYGGIAFSFLAVERLPLADAICLVMLSPIISSTVAYLVLGEPFRWQEQAAIGTSSIGMVFVVKPSFIFGSDVSLDPLGVTYGLIAAISAGSAYVFVRILGTRAKMPWENVCFAQSLGQLSLALPFLYAFGQHFKFFPTLWEFSMIVMGACIGAGSQVLMTIGMQREKSAAAGAMRMSDLLFGFIWQELLTQDRVSFLSVIGAFMIVGGVLIIVFTKEKLGDAAVSDSDAQSSGPVGRGPTAMGGSNSKPVYNPLGMDDEEMGMGVQGGAAASAGGGAGGTVGMDADDDEGGLPLQSFEVEMEEKWRGGLGVDDNEDECSPTDDLGLGARSDLDADDVLDDADMAALSAMEASLQLELSEILGDGDGDGDYDSNGDVSGA